MDQITSAFKKLQVSCRGPKFPQFNNFPPEIRQAIWEMAIPENGDLVKMDWTTYDLRRPMKFKFKRGSLPLLAVCKEARAVALAHYGPIYSSHWADRTRTRMISNSQVFSSRGRAHIHRNQENEQEVDDILVISACLDRPIGLPRFDFDRDVLLMPNNNPNGRLICSMGRHPRRIALYWPFEPDSFYALALPQQPLDLVLIKFKNKREWRELARRQSNVLQEQAHATINGWKAKGEVPHDFPMPRVLPLADFFEMKEGREMGQRYQKKAKSKKFVAQLLHL